MRTETITRTLYTLDELRERFPSAYGRAWDHYRQSDLSTVDDREAWDSLRALDNRVGYDRRRRYHAWGDGLGQASDLTGRRALAWLENQVLADLRLPWLPITRSRQRRRHVRYGRDYRPGKVPPCPLTGVFYDEILLDALRADLVAGESVGAAMLALEHRLERVLAEEQEYLLSEEAFLDALYDLEYTEDGELA